MQLARMLPSIAKSSVIGFMEAVKMIMSSTRMTKKDTLARLSWTSLLSRILLRRFARKS